MFRNEKREKNGNNSLVDVSRCVGQGKKTHRSVSHNPSKNNENRLMLQAAQSDKKTTGLWLFKLDNVPAYCQGESIPGMTKGKVQGFEGSRVKDYKAEDERLRT
jgi:hypothetical protein